MTLTVIGGGTMGAGIAQVAAEKGMTVLLHDTDLDRLQAAHNNIAKLLEKKVEKGKLTADSSTDILNRIFLMGDLEVAARDGDFVIEAIFENLQAKLDLLKKLDKLCGPEVVIASNTSTISITLMAGSIGRADKFIGMHFFSPVPAMHLVEVIKGKNTSEETLKAAIEMAERMGKTPIAVNDIPGFIVNRFMCLLYNEAASLVESGSAAPKDIDTAMKLGANHPMGPLEIADMAGVDIVLDALEALYSMTGDERYKPARILKDMVAEGKVGKKAGRGFYDYSSY